MRVISLTLDSIRHSYIRQEGSIIFSLLERTRCCFNPNTYDLNILSVDDSSLVEFMLRETEKLHAQVNNQFSTNNPESVTKEERAIYNLMSPICVLPCGIGWTIKKPWWASFFSRWCTRWSRSHITTLAMSTGKSKTFFFQQKQLDICNWNLHQILFYGVLHHFDTLILGQY